MDSVIEEIKTRLDIVDFINSYVPLKRVGRNFRALCPFHQEKTPSFIVSPERQIWRCFGACQEGGDVIKFYMKWENLTFFEAVKELAQKVGVEIKGKYLASDLKWQEKSKLLAVNKAAAKFFSFVLWNTKYGKKALDYLKERGISEKMIKKFEIGYAPDSEDSLVNYLVARGFSKEYLIKAGVVSVKKGKVRDRFRGRLMFPLKDFRGEVLGFSGRTLEDSSEPKYINIPETLIYKKRHTLFGLDAAKDSIKEKGEVYVVEGEFDVITPYQQGITNIVAIKGSAVTREQLLLLKRFAKKVVFLLDNDEAGREAVFRGFENARGLDIELYVVVIDFAKDPDEAVKSDLTRFKKLLKNPKVIYDFFIEEEIRDKDLNNPYIRAQFLERIGSIIGTIDNPVVKDYYVKKVAEIAGVSEKVVIQTIKKVKRKKKSVISKKTEAETKVDPEKFLIGLIFQSENPTVLLKQAFNVLSPSDFSTPSLRELMELMKKDKDKFNFEEFFQKLSDPLKDLANELYLYSSLGEVEIDRFEKLVFYVKLKALKRSIAELLKKEGKEEEVKELIEKLKEVEEKYLNL